jgi:hypothetical protein
VANLAGKPGGAVPPLANVQTNRATGRREKTPDAFERLMQFVRRQRFSRLCVLMNPYPAGRAVHPDLAGEIPEKTFSCGPDISGGTQEVKLQIRQLTNRRMRTFIAAPSARNVNNTEDPP